MRRTTFQRSGGKKNQLCQNKQVDKVCTFVYRIFISFRGCFGLELSVSQIRSYSTTFLACYKFLNFVLSIRERMVTKHSNCFSVGKSLREVRAENIFLFKILNLSRLEEFPQKIRLYVDCSNL